MKRKQLLSTCVVAGILLFRAAEVAGQNYMTDFLHYQQKADSVITSLGYKEFVTDNYYLSVEKSHPYTGQGVYGSRWTDTSLLKSGNVYPRAWEYVYLVKGIDEIGFRILVDRTPQSLKEIFYSSYKEICFVNGLPVDKKKQPRNFLPAQKIRSLIGAKAKTDLSTAVCELNWDTQKKGSVCYGGYYYKVVYAQKEAGKNYVYDLKVDPATGKILGTNKEEAAIGEIDAPFRPVNQ